MNRFRLTRDIRVVDYYYQDFVILPKGTDIAIFMKFDTYAECYCLSEVHPNQPNKFLASYNEFE